MPQCSALSLLACLAAEARPALEVDTSACTARFEAGALVRLTDADGTQYVSPPTETIDWASIGWQVSFTLTRARGRKG